MNNLDKVLNFAEVAFTDTNFKKDKLSINLVVNICQEIINGHYRFTIPDNISLYETLKWRNVLNFLSSQPVHLLTNKFINNKSNQLYTNNELLMYTNSLTANLSDVSMFFEYEADNAYIFHINKYEKIIINNKNNKGI